MQIAFFAVVGVLLLLYAAPLLLSRWSSRNEVEKLLREGDLSEAEILGYSPGRGGVWVEYEFTPIGATGRIRCRKLLVGNMKRVAIGSKVAVRYKSQFPSISVIVPYGAGQIPS